jgi:hypothetical protein
MDIPKHQFPIKSLIFLKSNCHAKMAPDNDPDGPELLITVSKSLTTDNHRARDIDPLRGALTDAIHRMRSAAAKRDCL